MPVFTSTSQNVLSSKALSFEELTSIAQALEQFHIGERQALARALHDGPMQTLAAALTQLDFPDREASQAAAKTLVQQALEALQAIENGLFIHAMDLLPLPEALSHRLTQLKANAIHLALRNEAALNRFPTNSALPIFLLGEALGHFTRTSKGQETQGRLVLGRRFGVITLQGTLSGKPEAVAKLREYPPVRNALFQLAIVGGRFDLRGGRIIALLPSETSSSRSPQP